VLVPLAAVLVWGRIQVGRLDSAVAALQARGEPVSEGELWALEPIPREDPQNAGRYYGAALSLAVYPRHRIAIAYDYRAASSPTAEQLAEAERFLETNAPVLEMMDRGAPLARCDVGDDHYLYHSYTAMVASSVRTRLVALRGQGDAAAESLLSLVRFSRIYERSLREAPMKSWSVAHQVIPDLRIVLEATPSEASLARLQEAIDDLDAPAAIRKALRITRVRILEDLREGDVRPFGEAGMAAMVTRGSRALLVYGEAVSELREVDLVEAGTLASTDPLVVLQRLEVLPNRGPYWPIKYLAASLYSNSAIVRCGRTAIAIERFRRTHGRPPERLDELVPAFLSSAPSDPFTNRPLFYRTTEGGYAVYSVGENGADDGGDFSRPPGKAQRDVGVRITLHQTAPHGAAGSVK
jgi:hypothetical protein